VRTIFKLGTILMFYCLVAGSLLAFVHIKTAPIITANKEAASGDAVRIQVLPGMVGGFVQQGEESEFTYWIGYRDTGRKQPGGYIFIAYGKGYQSTIETMIGVDINSTIIGVKVLFQQETPGMGDKIEEIRAGEEDPWFIHQFIGKSASDNIAITNDDGVIDAITGATVSSRAVTNSISNGLKNLMAVIAGKEIVIEEEPEDDLMEQLMRRTEDEEDEDNLMEQLMRQAEDEDD